VKKILKKILIRFQVFIKKSPEDLFLTKHYQLHNIARLKHLDSLGLDLYGKSVIEFGAGIGDHTIFYLLKNCKVFSTDARPELLNIIKKKYGTETMVLNVESELHKIISLPRFEIIHCYGLLYHISNPEAFLRSLKGKGSMMFLETCVSGDYNDESSRLVKENKNDPTQAFSGIGSRPSREWIFNTLKEIFGYVYVPNSQPDHPEFPKDWTKGFDLQNSVIRAVFIASENKLDLPTLSDKLLKIYN